MDRHARLAPLMGLLAADAAALVVLRRLGDAAWAQVRWTDLGGWLTVTPPDDAVMALLRLVGLAVGWWLLATTVAYLLARLACVGGAVAALRPLTVPWARGAVDRAVAVGVSAALLAPAPALADVGPTPPALLEPHEVKLVGEPAAVEPAVAAPSARPALPSGGAENEADARAEAPDDDLADDELADDEQPDEREHVVERGEHLWAIAAADLASAAHADLDEPPAGDVAVHWRALVDANVDRIASGDPDLIHPGERLILPEPPGR